MNQGIRFTGFEASTSTASSQKSDHFIDIFRSSAPLSLPTAIEDIEQSQSLSLTNYQQSRWWLDEERGYNYYNRNLINKDDGSTGDISETGDEEQDEKERLASLEALRYALHHAPFCRNMHTLMSVPNEECYEMIGIPTKLAIRIEQLSYKTILDNVNIEIPKGKIYALLGSANNGKSILLKCILGREKPTSGSIVVFGQKPTICPLSAICVGYMPQRVALHPELTIEQTLIYYGRLYQLPPCVIDERIELLDSMFKNVENGAPLLSTFVRQLDDDNLWRLSLMVAMIHSPPLLLLDEPTDNVDPLVRSTIWSYLEKLCDNEGLTIVFTTKHPEELCYAYKAGLMRDGHVYVENRPGELLRNYHSSTYIQMYNKFCMANTPRRIRPSIAPYLATMPPAQLSFQTSIHSCQSKSNTEEDEEFSHPNETSESDITITGMENLVNRRHSNQNESDSIGSYSVGSLELNERVSLPMAQWPIAEYRRAAYISHIFNFDLKRLFSLIRKNFHIIYGNLYRLIMFYFMFPILQIILVCFLFGYSTIQNLPVAIKMPANDLNNDRMEKLIRYTIDPEVFQPQIVENVSLDKIYSGRSWATIIPWSIEQSLNYSSPQDDDQQEINRCTRWHYCSFSLCSSMFGLRLYVDNSNYFIHQLMNFSLINSMLNLLSNETRLRQLFSENCSELYLSMRQYMYFPIDIEEVIYGSTQFRFFEFILPGFLISIIFAHSLILTSYFFIKEQIAGLQERCLIAGASGIEILTSHLISQLVLLFLQELILMLILLKIFGIPSRGTIYAPWLLVSLQGFMAIIAGLFLAVICPQPLAASLFTSAIFLPGFFLSGIIWPVESMPTNLYYISLILPLTSPINALRYIISLSPGPEVYHEKIMTGFCVSGIYIIILMVLTLFIFKMKIS